MPGSVVSGVFELKLMRHYAIGVRSATDCGQVGSARMRQWRGAGAPDNIS
jgi:hypothetical protein